MWLIEEWCAISFLSDRVYDNRTGEKNRPKNPINNAWGPNLVGRRSEQEFRGNL